MNRSTRLLLCFACIFASLGVSLAQEQDNQVDTNVLEVTVSPECAAVLIVGAGAGGAAATYTLLGPLLAVLGFTSTGVAGASFASWWQSSMSVISSGSIFATLQSIAMTGAGPSVIVVGGTLAAAPTALFVKTVCTRVDSVDPDSMAGNSVALAVAAVRKADHASGWYSQAKQWLGETLVGIGETLQTSQSKSSEEF